MKIGNILILALLSFFCTDVFARKEKEYDLDTKRKYVKAHDRAFISMGEKIRDPFILLGPDGNYYLTGTTAGTHWGDTIGVKVWKSADLCEWKSLGFVWNLNTDGKTGWYFNRPAKDFQVKNPYAVWAPEIHYFNDTWWLTVSRNGGGHGLLKSISGKVEGPYEETATHYDKGIDSHLFGDNGKVYYCYGANRIALMETGMEGLQEHDFAALELPGKHPMGYEGILMMKYADKYLWMASGRYGYEPTNTYDLYYAVSERLDRGYGARRMAIKNAGHGNLFCDKDGQWWCTAFDHEFTPQWCCWLVPVELCDEDGDVLIEVLDDRFRPTPEDQEVVRRLAREGMPDAWKGKSPWWRESRNK